LLIGAWQKRVFIRFCAAVLVAGVVGAGGWR
jgi:hypothetical protein